MFCCLIGDRITTAVGGRLAAGALRQVGVAFILSYLHYCEMSCYTLSNQILFILLKFQSFPYAVHFITSGCFAVAKKHLKSC